MCAWGLAACAGLRPGFALRGMSIPYDVTRPVEGMEGWKLTQIVGFENQ